MHCPSCNRPLLFISADRTRDKSIFVPAKYGKYLAERVIASGGMGLVLIGKDEEMGTPVAIKLIQPGSGIDTQAALRFKQEAQLMARVRHRYVVKVLAR